MPIKLLIISALIFSSLITFFLSIFAATKLRKTGTFTYVLLMICISLYSLGYAFEISSSTIEGIFSAIKLEYIGIVFTPAFWFIFALQYTGYENKKIRHLFPFLFIIPLVTLILVFTNEYHHLYYRNLGIQETKYFFLAVIKRGIWYYVFLVFNNIIILFGNILFFRLILRATGFLRKQAIITFIASVIPWIGDIFYLTGNSLYNIDHTPFFLTIMGPLLLFALFRYKMLDLTPIARSIVFDEIKDPVFVLDNENRLVDQNNAANDFLITPFGKLNGAPGDLELHSFDILLKQIQNENNGTVEFHNTVSGVTNYYNSHITNILLPSKKKIGNILTLQNITIEKNMIDKLHSLATTDELTGINNRRNLIKLFKMELDKSKRYKRPVSLLIIDLDFFKLVNDTYGHQTGDITLQRVAQSFSKELRACDILGRYGGEEFVVVLPETESPETAIIAERLNMSIASLKIPYKDKTISITISIGTITIDAENIYATIESSLSKADEALYKAKKEGRNRVIDYDSLSHPSLF